VRCANDKQKNVWEFLARRNTTHSTNRHILIYLLTY